MTNIVVIGAGQAGLSLVAKLRKDGFDGAITLIGNEPVPPYQRPPLSKKYLTGEIELERLFLRPEQFYADQKIALRLEELVTGIDRASKTVLLENETVHYDQLVLTTGSAPRHLPPAIGGDLNGVHVVRTLSDVDAMTADFVSGKRLLIVGGGYIGLEAAAVAATKGLRVTLVEMADRILQRVAAPATSDFFRDLHRQNGVDIRENVGLDHIVGRDGRVTGAVLADGMELAVDAVIVGIGIIPNTMIAEEAGLDINMGITTDAMGRTNDPNIWAAGDCASLEFRGQRIRLESVQNAIDQAEAVAANIMGAKQPYEPKPWFWSDQYEVKLQIAGLNMGYDRTITRDSDDGISIWYYQGDTLLAVDAMNAPRDYMVGKRLIEAGKSPASDSVSDPTTVLKDLLRA